MTQYEMTEKLSDKMHVTMEEAKAALEACNWDMLDAALLLEQQSGAKAEAYSTEAETRESATETREGNWKITMKNIGNVIRRIINIGNRNRLEIRRKGEMIMELPVTVVVLLMIVAFWVCIPLLVIGLFTGFRYSFSGPELGRDAVNNAMDKAAATAEKVKEEVTGEH